MDKNQLVVFLANAWACIYAGECDTSVDRHFNFLYARLERLSLVELETSYKLVRETLGY